MRERFASAKQCARAFAWRTLAAFVLALGVALSAAAAPADIARGLAWLEGRVQPDGSLAAQSRTADAPRTSCEVGTTLLQLGGSTGKAVALAGSIVRSAGAATQTLGCVNALRRSLGQDVAVDELEERRTAEGGYAAFGNGAAANALDTGWALFTQLPALSSERAAATLAWLRAVQAMGGSFSAAGQADLQSTAAVLRAVRQPAASGSVDAAAIGAAAAQWLLAERDAAGPWAGDAAATALAFEAVHPYSGSAAGLAASVESHLLSLQAADGSWSGDPFVTALALRALALTAQPPVAPGTAALKLRAVDAATQQPVAGAVVELQLAQTGGAFATQTDAAGIAQFGGLAAQTLQVRVSAAGYAVALVNAQLAAGQTLDLGDVALGPLAGNARPGTVFGAVRDAATGARLAGATVFLDPGNVSVRTDASGRFGFTGVLPGLVRVTATLAGYGASVVNGTLEAGGNLEAPLALAPLAQATGATAGVSGTVKFLNNNVQAQPLANARVTLFTRSGPLVTTTNASGQFGFPPVARDVVAVQAEATNFRTSSQVRNLAQEPQAQVDFLLVPGPSVVTAADLRMVRVSSAGLYTNPATLAASGTLTAEAVNLGQLAAPAGTKFLAFEDRDGDGKYTAGTDNPLGSAALAAPLAPAERRELSVAVQGTLLFRDSAIYVMADSEGAIDEPNEGNNTEACACTAGLPFAEDFDDGVADGAQPFANTAGTRADWTVEGGAYAATRGGAVAFGDARWADYDAETRVYFTNGAAAEAALAFRITDEANSFQFRIKGGEARIVSAHGGVPRTHAQAPATVLAQTWHRLRVELRGTRVRAFLDGKLLMTASDVDLPRGKVGFMQDDVGVRYDDLRVSDAPLFEEDFSGATHAFRQSLYGNNAAPTVVNEELQRTSSGASWAGDRNWTDYTVEADIRSQSGNDAGLMVLYKDAPPPGSNAVGVRSGLAYMTVNDRLVRFSTFNGSGTFLPAVRASTVDRPADNKFRFRAEVSGRTMRWFVNNQFMFEYEGFWSNGAIGIVQDPVVAQYDNFRVTRTGANRPDVSASLLAAEPLGTGGTRVKLRVGNGGHGTVLAGLPVQLYLDTGAGPARIGAMATTQPLARGKYEDLAVNLTALASTVRGTLTAKVDESAAGGETVSECNEDNNEQSIVIGTPADQPPPTLTLAADKPVYQVGEAVRYTARIANTGTLATEAGVLQVRILAPDGQVLQTQAPLAVQPVGAGSTGESTGAWLVPSMLAASGYSVEARYGNASGYELARASAAFAVESAGADPLFSARIAADRTAYSAAQAVQLDALVGNRSTNTVLQQLVARTTVRDAAGQLVFDKGEPIAELAPGGSRPFAYAIDAGTLAPGSYTAAVQLATAAGAALASGTTGFTVLPASQTGAGLTGTLTAAPSQMRIGTSAQFTLVVANASAQSLSNVPVTVRVIDPVTRAVSGTLATVLADLPAGQARSAVLAWTAAGAAGRTLVASATATLGGQEIPLAQANLSLLGAFTATISAGSVEVDAGSTVSIGYSTTNPASSPQTFTGLLTIANAQGQVLASYPLSHEVSGGATYAGSRSFTVPQQPQVLTVTLSQAAASGNTVLATATFNVVPAAKPLGIVTGVSPSARVLALVSCPLPNHEDEAACVADRSRAIETYLGAMGLAVKAVATRDAFMAEMRCGGYNTYWISGGAIKLGASDIAELAAAVRAGDTLWMDGVHDSRNQLLHEVAGVKSQGQLPHPSQVAQLLAGGLNGTLLPTLGTVTRFALTTGVAQALFTRVPGQQAPVPAVVSNLWGQGKSLLFAFDLAQMLREAAAQPSEALRGFMAASVSYSAPAPQALAAGDITGLEARITNPGPGPLDLRMVATLPAGLSPVSAAPDAQVDVLAGGITQATWDFTLTPGATQTIRWLVRVIAAGSYTIPFDVLSLPPVGSASAPKPRGSGSWQIDAAPAAGGASCQ